MMRGVTKKEAQFNERLGLWLKQLRMNRELSQLEIGEAIGIHRHTIARYEAGKGMPLFVFLRICEAVDVGAAEVLKW